MCDRLKKFLFEQLRCLGKFNIPFVLDAYYVRPIDLKDLKVEGNFAAVYLGYPTIPVEEKLRQVRDNEVDSDWTKGLSDKQLSSDLSRFIQSSNRMRNWCEEANVTFIDVSFDWTAQIEKVYKLLCDYVKE